MDQKIASDFADVIALAQATFADVEHEIEATPRRAILRIRATHGKYRLFITELLGETMCEYRYYLLHKNFVIAGFDNAPDPRAIRLKYGRIGKQHAGENIPHLHLADKTQLTLTEEMTFPAFVEWVKTNVPPPHES